MYLKILLFILLSYGIVNIAIFGSIFETWRNFWVKYNPSFFGKLFTCPMCLSFYVGLILSITFTIMDYTTPFMEYGITNIPLLFFLDACFTSGCVWLIYMLDEMMSRLGNKEN